MSGVCLLALSTSPSPTLRTVYAPRPVCVWWGGRGGEEEDEERRGREETELDKREDGGMRRQEEGVILSLSDVNTHLELKAINRVDSS